ncbi:hypothetical protein SCB29_27390 [Paraburkholderia sp. SIMBA_055]
MLPPLFMIYISYIICGSAASERCAGMSAFLDIPFNRSHRPDAVELMRERSRTQVSDISRTLSDPSASADDILSALEVWAKTLDAEPEWSVLGVEFKLQGRRNPAFATASQALLDAHRDGLAYCIGQIFARLGRVPSEPPTVLAAAFMGLSQGLALQRSMLAEVPIGHMIMVFLRSLLTAAPPVR